MMEWIRLAKKKVGNWATKLAFECKDVKKPVISWTRLTASSQVQISSWTNMTTVQKQLFLILPIITVTNYNSDQLTGVFFKVANPA